MKRLDLCGMIVGLMIKGKINPQDVPELWLVEQYQDVVRMMREGKSIEEIGESNYLSILLASERLVDTYTSSLDSFDWISMLRTAYLNDVSAERLYKIAGNLSDNKPIDAKELADISNALMTASTERFEYTPMSKVSNEAFALLPSYYKPIDTHAGGIPENALTIVAGNPASGKTFLAIRLLGTRLAKEKDEVGAMISFEMMNTQVKDRAVNALKFTKDVQSRLLMEDKGMNLAETITWIRGAKAAHKNLRFVVIDYMDFMYRGAQNKVHVAEDCYLSLAALAKELDLSLLLLAQLNGQYTGGMPMANNLRWSRMAEAAAALILTVYNPNTITVKKQNKHNKRTDNMNWTLPESDGTGYVGLAKCKFLNPHDGALGAIQILFKDKEALSKKTKPVVWANKTDFKKSWYPYSAYLGG